MSNLEIKVFDIKTKIDTEIEAEKLKEIFETYSSYSIYKLKYIN